MNLAEYQQIKKELLADLKKARGESDAKKVASCKSALVALREIKKTQKFDKVWDGKKWDILIVGLIDNPDMKEGRW